MGKCDYPKLKNDPIQKFVYNVFSLYEEFKFLYFTASKLAKNQL